MPNNNTDVQRKAGFFHSLGKVLTESTKFAGNEKYKSAHNVLSNEVWIEEVPYAPNFNDAIQNNLDSDIVNFIGGDLETSSILYPLAGSNYQTWFLDSGNPTPQSNGFDPSDGWCKPLISPSDISNSAGVPSFGYELVIYRPDDSSVSYDNAFYDVDYFGGLVRFDPGKTPIDLPLNSGLAFQFNKTNFESSSNKLTYIRNLSNNAPRATAFQYIGKTLKDFDITESAVGQGLTISNSEISISLTQSSGLTFSNNGELVVNIDNDTLKIDNNQIYVSGQSVYQVSNSLTTSGNNQSTGLLLTYKPLNHSSIKVFVNGQALLLGTSTSGVDCYLSNDGGSTAKNYNEIASGDTLYFNGQFVGWDLSTTDRIILIYEANVD
jgi:hypothetical protein